jgi:pimeloyl-ACP methyl ester carboxylesterase
LPCPVLVVRGKASAVFPRSVAARMGRVIPRAQLVTISMAGHAVMADNPADFTRAVMTFLVGIGIGARHRSGEAAR